MRVLQQGVHVQIGALTVKRGWEVHDVKTGEVSFVGDREGPSVQLEGAGRNLVLPFSMIDDVGDALRGFADTPVAGLTPEKTAEFARLGVKPCQ